MSFKKIAYGAFSSVYSVDKKEYFGFEGDNIVLKRNYTSSGTSLMMCGREMDILLRNRHPFVVPLLHIIHTSKFVRDGCFSPVGPTRGPSYREDDAHFIFPKASSDLIALIMRNPSARFAQLMSCQLLLGLEFLHSRGIMHRDIKPANILYFEAKRETEEASVYHRLVDPTARYYGTLKFSDFGLSKMYDVRETNSPNIATTWYRSPENCRGERYDYGIDIWSAGCVIYELFFGRSLFQIPANAVNQPEAILHAIDIGHPKSTSSSRPSSFLARSGLSSETIQMMCAGIRTTPEIFESVLQGMLQINPEERCSATTILNSEFFRDYRRYIEYYRRQLQPRIYTPLVIHHILEREWVLPLVINLYEDRRNYTYFTMRMLFHCVHIYYRYLDFVCKKGKKREVTSNECGFYLKKTEVEEVWSIIVYIVINYFSNALHASTPLRRVTTLTPQDAQKYEITFYRDVLKDGIYHPTPYEETGKMGLDFEEIDELGLLLHFVVRGKGIPSNEVEKETVNSYCSLRESVYGPLYIYLTTKDDGRCSSLQEAVEILRNTTPVVQDRD